MKLTKARLIKLVKDELTDLGYRAVKDSITGAQGLFIKPLERQFFLCLGMEISRYYESSFTASYYLSKTTRWGSLWGDIPRESYERIGRFLTNEERKVLLDEEYNGEGVSDAWWSGNENARLVKFVEAVKLTENRFLSQEDLFGKIEVSKEVAELKALSDEVVRLVNSGRQYPGDCSFTPSKPIDDIPLEWFRVAELVIRNRNWILNQNTVKALAGDSWHQFQTLRTA